MSPKRPFSEVSEPEQCHDLHTWKAQRADGQRPERTLNSVYEPSCEELPDKSWYALDHRDIDTKVSNMCQKLLKPVRIHAIFNAKEDENALQDLETWLQEPDLEDGRFLDRCIQIALNYLAKTHAADDSLVCPKVSDEEMSQQREFAATIWPLVRSITISTGSILLRNGICFLDLPGKLSRVV